MNKKKVIEKDIIYPWRGRGKCDEQIKNDERQPRGLLYECTV